MDITFVGMDAPSGQCNALVLCHHLDAGKRMQVVILAVFEVHPRKVNILGYVIIASKMRLLIYIYTHPSVKFLEITAALLFVEEVSLYFLTWSLVGQELVCQGVGGEGAASAKELSVAAGSSIQVHEKMLVLSFCIKWGVPYFS